MGVWNAQDETSIFRLFCLELIQTSNEKELLCLSQTPWGDFCGWGVDFRSQAGGVGFRGFVGLPGGHAFEGFDGAG